MTSMPASRSARAMILAPRSWPSRPGLATTTRILRPAARGSVGVSVSRRHVASEFMGPSPAETQCRDEPFAAVWRSAGGCAGRVGRAQGPPPARDRDAGRRAAARRRPPRCGEPRGGWPRLGVDRVRLTASWSAMAPDPESRRRPRFDATDSRQYRREPLARLDRAVRESRAAGMERDGRPGVLRAAVGGEARPGRAAGARLEPLRARVRPLRPGGGRALQRKVPRRARGPGAPVRLWTTWNEPNHGAFLRPQWERSRRRLARPPRPTSTGGCTSAAYDQIKTVSGRTGC